LAKSVHPLLATRGVPGTHDVALAIDCLDNLRAGNNAVITRFDKKIDDRAVDLEINSQPVGLIVLEGWCLGAQPQPELALSTPINSLEQVEDPEGIWRNYVNRALQGDYQRLFASIDQMIMLQAPSFETVHQWRVEQERKMIDSVLEQGLDAPPEAMNDEQIQRFIQHFQRITEEILRELPSRADHLFTLDRQRRIGNYSQPVKSKK
jgi:D-glycerate 3-kinase